MQLYYLNIPNGRKKHLNIFASFEQKTLFKVNNKNEYIRQLWYWWRTNWNKMGASSIALWCKFLCLSLLQYSSSILQQPDWTSHVARRAGGKMMKKSFHFVVPYCVPFFIDNNDKNNQWTAATLVLYSKKKEKKKFQFSALVTRNTISILSSNLRQKVHHPRHWCHSVISVKHSSSLFLTY